MHVSLGVAEQAAPRVVDTTLAGIHLEWESAELGDHDDVIAGYVVQWAIVEAEGAAVGSADASVQGAVGCVADGAAWMVLRGWCCVGGAAWVVGCCFQPVMLWSGCVYPVSEHSPQLLLWRVPSEARNYCTTPPPVLSVRWRGASGDEACLRCVWPATRPPVWVLRASNQRRGYGAPGRAH